MAGEWNWGGWSGEQAPSMTLGTGSLYNNQTWEAGTGLSEVDLFASTGGAGSKDAANWGMGDLYSETSSLNGAGTFGGLSSAGWGMVGSYGSKLAGGGYSGGTGGIFSSVGTLVGSYWGAPQVGAAIGAAVDIVAGKAMGGSAEGKARKEAKQYWQTAFYEMQGLSQQQSATRSELLARQGASGAVLRSGSMQRYRRTMQQEHSKQWSLEYLRHAEQYKAIRAPKG